MPIHYYFCEYCKTKKQRRSSFGDIVEVITCPNCNRCMQKQIQIPNVHYRGNGFSKTDVKKPYDPFDKKSLDEGMERTVK